MALNALLHQRVPRERRVPAKISVGGFTLAEILIVLALLGVLMTIVAPVFNPGRWRADSAVQEVMITLDAAQRMAVMRQHDVIVTFLLDQRRLRVHRDANNDGAVDSGEDTRVVELPETMAFSRGATPPVNGASDDVSFEVDGGGPRLIFHRNGSASESGTAYLRPVEGKMALDVDAARAVTVERATGEVRCFSYRTGSWMSSC